MKKGFSFADFLEELKNGEADILPKPVEERDERIYFLIVCEGEKTEPNYFNYFKRQLPKNLLSTVELVGEGDNTINVVQKAIIERDKRISDPINPNYDEIWAAF
ncbi:MAG: RloB family protein [Flavobacteriaceae bacterium]